MSMGPEKVEEQFSVTKVEKARLVVKSVSIAFFADPLHYIFYTALLLLVIGLFFGMNLSWEFDAIVAVLAAANIIQDRYKSNTASSDEAPRKNGQ